MSIVGRLFARWACHPLAAIRLMPLMLLIHGLAPANAEPDPVAAMVARVSPAVVRIVSVRPPAHEEDKATDKLAGASLAGQKTAAIGSGYIVDPSGYIGTNYHVVNGAISVYVITADGIRYPATIVGTPYQADIALLKIDSGRKQLPFIRFGDSDEVRVGDKVFAIGSPFGFDNTVTAGIISALNRDIMESPFDDYLQTDTAINHGNSGGPLFNMAGEVIGMNSVIYSPDPGFSGLAFAVPSNSLRFVFDRLMKTGKVGAGALPIHTQPVTWMLEQALHAPDLLGALVTSVQDDGGTMLQGKILPGDVIRTFNGETVLDPRDLARRAAKTPVGTDVILERCRGGDIQSVHVTIQRWPEVNPPLLNNEGARTLGLELALARGEQGQPIVTVASVDPNGTAADSGIQKGDTILEVEQTLVSEPDQALRIFWVQSSLKQHFVPVLVEHDKKSLWMPIAVPE